MRTKLRMWALIGFLGAFLGFGSILSAHQTDRAEQVSEIRADTGEVEQLFSISIEDLSHHLELTETGEFPSSEILEHARVDIASYLDDHTDVRADGESCGLIEANFIAFPAVDGRVHYHQQWQCPPNPSEVLLENRIMLDTHGGYRHMGRIQVDDAIFPTVFDPGYPTYTVYPDPGEELAEVESVFGRYFGHGLWHILLGFDHILFILVLLFAVRKLWTLLFVVTAFTLGHSVTLALSALDVWTVSDRIIEPVIALSILYVAAKNIISAAHWNHVWTLALLFSLVHGFGFSYILRGELMLPADQGVAALVAFNLGVEAGHLAIVAVAFPAVYWLRNHRSELFLGVNRWLNAAIAVAAAYWIVARLFFW